MRAWQRARSVHALRVTYRLGVPISDLGGAYPPVLKWLPGPRVRWSFGMADLYAGRYLEAWFPSNLPFDHFPFTLELTITGTAIPHTVVTNGSVTTKGPNRWTISFPPWFTTMSPLVELHAADTVQTASATTRLPVSNRPITISACKFVTGDEDLAARLPRIAALLSEQERRFGEFGGDSYVCFFHGASGGMEYGNATTTSESALRHEVIHSWFARGLTPASQADGWWDEGFTRYLESDGHPEPLDFRAPPVELCSRRPFQRTTAAHSYEAGSRVFRGIAALIGTRAPASSDAGPLPRPTRNISFDADARGTFDRVDRCNVIGRRVSPLRVRIRRQRPEPATRHRDPGVQRPFDSRSRAQQRCRCLPALRRGRLAPGEPR